MPIDINALDIAGLSHAGNKRNYNEDSIGIHAELGLAVLADGMGGCQGGQIASALAVRIVIEEVRARYSHLANGFHSKAGDGWHQSVLKGAFAKANGVIYRLAKRKPQWHGMGTTLVAALFHDDRVTVGHVGDSRLYRVRRNELQRITADHSLVQELMDSGFCTPEDLRGSLNKNLITRAVGIEQSVEAELQQAQVFTKDLYLLCSDGLTDLVEDSEIHLTLRENCCRLRRAAVSLVRLANERGGYDNVSAVIVRVRGSRSSRGLVGHQPTTPSD